MMLFQAICSKSFVLSMGLTLSCQALWSQEKTIQIKVPDGYDELTYDASKVNREDLDRWFTLSPVLSQNTNYLVPEDPSMCPVDDKAYVGCGSEQVRLNSDNAERNQEKIRARLDHLKAEEFPPRFEPIVKYFRAVQSFALWRNHQEIEFAQSHDVGTLERSYAPLAIDPKLSCASVLQKVRAADDSSAAWHLVTYDWQNCMWQAASKSIGAYPQPTWVSALRMLGVRERLVPQEN